MANRFTRIAIPGGDSGVWDTYEEPINLLGLGNNTLKLYDDAGALKLAPGRCGLDDGSQIGTIIVDTITAISIAALTASLWAKVELSKTGTALNIEITSIAGESDPTTLPASFTGGYDANKQGFYITGTKRVIGLIWINAAGAIEGIVNCLAGESYAGYSTSDNANDYIYEFQRLNGRTGEFLTNLNKLSSFFEVSSVFTVLAVLKIEVFLVTTAANSFLGNIPAAANWSGKRIKVLKVDTGAGVCTVTPNGAETFQGAAAFPLRKYGDFIELESDGTNIFVVGSLATLDSSALTGAVTENLAHGCGVLPKDTTNAFLVCTSADNNFSAGDKTAPLWGRSSREQTISADATNIIINAQDLATILNKTSHAVVNITSGKWIYRIKYSF